MLQFSLCRVQGQPWWKGTLPSECPETVPIWLNLLEPMTLHLGVMSSSPMLGIEPTLKAKIKFIIKTKTQTSRN